MHSVGLFSLSLIQLYICGEIYPDLILLKYKLHHLLLVYNISRYKFAVMLEIVTVLKIKDNNLVLIII